MVFVVYGCILYYSLLHYLITTMSHCIHYIRSYSKIWHQYTDLVWLDSYTCLLLHLIRRRSKFLFYYYCFVCEIFYLLAFYAVIFKRTIFYNFLLLIIFFFSCSNLVVSNEKVPLVVESFLLQRASESVHFAIRTYLYMLANPVVCCVPFMRLYSLFLSFVLVCESIHYLNMLANPVENLLLSTLVRMNEC